MEDIKKLAKKFLRRYKHYKNNLTYDSIKTIIEDLGFEIVEYNGSPKNDCTEDLLNILKIKEYSLRVKAFSYVDGKRRIVFIDSQESKANKFFLGLHELGHIYCKHSVEENVLARNGLELDNEADEFKLYILNNKKRGNMLTPAIFVIVMMSIMLIAFYLLLHQQTSKTTFEYVAFPNVSIEISDFPVESKIIRTIYITPTGQRYHYSKNCAGHNATEVTLKQAEGLGKTPCKNCVDE